MIVKLELQKEYLNILDPKTEMIIFQAHYSPTKYAKIKQILPEGKYDIEDLTRVLALFRNIRGIYYTKEEVQNMLFGEVKKDE